MKRKKALEPEEQMQSVKLKKRKSHNIEGEDPEETPVIRSSRKRDKKVIFSDEAPEVILPETLVGRKKKRRPTGDINQNGEPSDELKTNNKTPLSSFQTDNALQNRAGSDSPSDFQPLGQLVKKKDGLKSTKTKTKRVKDLSKEEEPYEAHSDPGVKHGVLKVSKNKELEEENFDNQVTGVPAKKTKKKVRIDETESLKVKRELADTEPHFSAKELPAKIIKSKLNKNLTEEVKVSPLTVQPSKKDKRTGKKPKHIEEIKQEMDTDADLPIKEESIDLKLENLYDDKSELETFTVYAHQLIENGKKRDSSNSEDSDLEVYYINKNAEKEIKKQNRELLFKKQHSLLMSKEDQLILTQRIQECIPEDDTLSYKYRAKKLEWEKIAFKNYTIEQCQKVWSQLLKKVRHFRLLFEVTHDIKRVIELNDLSSTKLKPKASKNSNKKHPDMPKRPLTSYFLYYIRKRDKIVKERPDLDTLELNKYISEKYQNLPSEKRQKYEQLAAKNKEEYKRQMQEFYAKHPEMKKVIIKKEKLTKPKPPKRPANPFKLFVQAELHREEIADDDKAEFREVCKEKWRQMCDSKKLVWINLAEEKHQEYVEELNHYMSAHPEYTPKSHPKQILNKQELYLKDKLAGKPKKPPNTAYSLFISITAQSSEIANIPVKERWYYTSSKWKAMSPEERDQYKLLLTQMHDQYQKDLKAYLDSLPEEKRQKELLLTMPKKRKSSSAEKPSTSGTKSTRRKKMPARTKSAAPSTKKEVENPVAPPRTAYKYFAEKYEGDNAKEAWKNLDSDEKGKFENELGDLKAKYIKDFEAYLKSLSKEELAAFCANRKTQEEFSTSEDSESESEHGEEDSFEDSSDSSDTGNESDDDN